MAQAVRQAQAAGDPAELYRRVNRGVRRRYWEKAGRDPATHVTIDESADTFAVNLETKEIHVPGWATVHVPRAPHGFLAHENMHVVFAPGSQERDAAATTAVIRALRANGVNPSPPLVKVLTNTVLDILGDFIAANRGITEIGSRFLDYVKVVLRTNGAPVTDPGLFYKTVQLALIKEHSGPRGFSYRAIGWREVEAAVEKVARLYKVPRGSEEYSKLLEMSKEMEYLLTYWEGRMDGILTSTRAFAKAAEDVAQILIRYYKELAQLDEEQGGHQCPVAAFMLRFRDPAATTIVYNNFLPAFSVLSEEPPEVVEAYVDARWAGLWRFLEKLLRRLLVHVGVPRPSPSAYIRTSVPFYENPEGDIDIESVAARKAKPTEPLMTEYDIRLRKRKGLRQLTKAVPERVVILMDESGSTWNWFSADAQITIKLAEALTGLGVIYGLRKLGGAKNVTIMKFGDVTKTAYSGTTSNMKKVVAGIVGSLRVGGGTNIVPAVETAIRATRRNDALVVLTDAEIGLGEAEKINEMLKGAVRSGSIGFLVFMVINSDPDVREVVSTIEDGLPRARSIVTVVSDMNEFRRAMQTIGKKIQRAYAPGAGK